MKIKKSYLFVFLAGLFALFAILSAINAKKNNAANQNFKRTETIVSVKSEKLVNTNLYDYVSTNGEIESKTKIEIFPDMAGKLDSVLIELGSAVKRGQIIAWVDPGEPGAHFEKSPIIAPISGNIVTRPLKMGTTVSLGTAIATIGDIENLQICANIPERYVAVLKKGLSAKIMLQAYPETIFSASVAKISPVLDPATRTKEIILTFDKKDSRINAGMFAKIILYTEIFSGFPALPTSALTNRNGKFFAFVINEDSTVSEREITLGKSVDSLCQILSGINEGEIAVTAGQTSLSNGAKVLDLSGNVKNPKLSENQNSKNPNSNQNKISQNSNQNAGEKK